MTNSTRFQFFIARRLSAAIANLLAVCAVLLLLGLPARAEFVDLYTGTSTYSVPIVTPPSTNGMGPNLALQYSSGGGGDLLGDGWSLAGLGLIERRGPNYGRAPTYTASDTFVLNWGGGGKLVYTGNDLTNTVGNFYHTEIENYMRIEFTASSSWVVTDKDGTKYFFGQTEASQLNNRKAPSQVFRWYLDKVMDIHGVYWSVTYDGGSNTHKVPKQIVYSAGGSLACNPAQPSTFASCRTVDFIKEPRPNGRFVEFWSGSDVLFDFYRLTRIDVRLGGNLVRKYALGYSESPCWGSELRARRNSLRYKSTAQTATPLVRYLCPQLSSYTIRIAARRPIWRSSS